MGGGQNFCNRQFFSSPHKNFIFVNKMKGSKCHLLHHFFKPGIIEIPGLKKMQELNEKFTNIKFDKQQMKQRTTF